MSHPEHVCDLCHPERARFYMRTMRIDDSPIDWVSFDRTGPIPIEKLDDSQIVSVAHQFFSIEKAHRDEHREH